MKQEEKNWSAEEDENLILLTEENAAIIFKDTAEADENNIESIDLTADDE